MSYRFIKKKCFITPQSPLSVTIEVKTEYPSSGLMHSTIKTAAIETIATIMWKSWIVAIVQLKILDDCGDFDDRDDRLETRLDRHSSGDEDSPLLSSQIA